jgi:hypothetical protein
LSRNPQTPFEFGAVVAVNCLDTSFNEVEKWLRSVHEIDHNVADDVWRAAAADSSFALRKAGSLLSMRIWKISK